MKEPLDMPADINRKLIHRHEWEAVDDILPAGIVEVYVTDTVRSPIEIWSKFGSEIYLTVLTPEMLAAIRSNT